MIRWIRNILHSASGADDWQRWWDARVEALELRLGRCDGTVYHSPAPLHLEGYADVLRFRHHGHGITYVTCDLIGNPRQIPNQLGNYELMMCTREECPWAPSVLSRLAKYTHDAPLHPGDTMELGHGAPRDSTLKALLFALPDEAPASFEVRGRRAGLMLCIGITASEFATCRVHNSRIVLRMLKEQGIFPYTEMKRRSVRQEPAAE